MDNQIQIRIKAAVSAGEFRKASELWEICAEQVAGEILSGTCSPARLDQMRELVDWTRSVVTCARAHAQHRLNNRITELHVAAVYSRTLH